MDQQPSIPKGGGVPSPFHPNPVYIELLITKYSQGPMQPWDYALAGANIEEPIIQNPRSIKDVMGSFNRQVHLYMQRPNLTSHLDNPENSLYNINFGINDVRVSASNDTKAAKTNQTVNALIKSYSKSVHQVRLLIMFLIYFGV